MYKYFGEKINHQLSRAITSTIKMFILIARMLSHFSHVDSLWPHGLYPTRLFCSWDYPGKNTGVGCHFLLQGIFPTQELNPHHFGSYVIWVTKNGNHKYSLCTSDNSPVTRWCHPTISSCIIPFSSCLQSFPALGSFFISWLFTSGGQSIRVSSSASVLPMIMQDWFPLGLTGWIASQSKGLSRVFFDITVQKHQFFGAQFSLWYDCHIYLWLLEKP